MPHDFPYEAFLSRRVNDKAGVRLSSLPASTGRMAGGNCRRLRWPQHGPKAPSDLRFGPSHFRSAKLGPCRFRDPPNRERRAIPGRLDDNPVKGSLTGSDYTNWRSANREPDHAAIKEETPEP